MGLKLEFDPATFIALVGERLVLEFGQASVAGTPGLVGSARENPARRQLEKLLPAFVGAGSGIVMDSFGQRSTQQDIVFYERDFCPIYSINDTPEATYFPVEGVLAVGEVKSTVDKDTLFDALDKLRSVKELKRFSQKSDNQLFQPTASFRPYGSGASFAAAPSEEYNQENNYNDQIFRFLICKSFRNSADAILSNISEYCSDHGSECMPNLIVALDNGFIQSIDHKTMSLQYSPVTADGVAFIPDNGRAFSFLVHMLRRHAREGRSVPLHALDRYMASISGPLPDCTFRLFPGRQP